MAKFKYIWGKFELKGEYKKIQENGQRMSKYIYWLYHEGKLVEQTIGDWASHDELTKEAAFENMLPEEIQKEIMLKAMDEIK